MSRSLRALALAGALLAGCAGNCASIEGALESCGLPSDARAAGETCERGIIEARITEELAERCARCVNESTCDRVAGGGCDDACGGIL